jgi:hypothetical protein
MVITLIVAAVIIEIVVRLPIGVRLPLLTIVITLMNEFKTIVVPISFEIALHVVLFADYQNNSFVGIGQSAIHRSYLCNRELVVSCGFVDEIVRGLFQLSLLQLPLSTLTYTYFCYLLWFNWTCCYV